MTPRRHNWLISALRVEFIDQNKALQYRNKTREIINNNRVERIFDNFNVLIHSSDLEQVTNDYLTLLQSINTKHHTTDAVIDLNINQKSYADNLLKKIIYIGSSQLLDNCGHIDEELISLLHWQEHTNKISHARLLCAYVGGVFQFMYSVHFEKINENASARECAEKYINGRYKKLVFEMLEEKNWLSSQDAEELAASQAINFKSPGFIATAVASSALAISGLVALSVYAYKSFSEYNTQTTDDKDSKKAQSIKK